MITSPCRKMKSATEIRKETAMFEGVLGKRKATDNRRPPLGKGIISLLRYLYVPLRKRGGGLWGSKKRRKGKEEVHQHSSL